ncbi:MAG: L,D-transpeptidase family protein [Oligoflexia bacterium]|nr:L,D-transpeptidase family protein [Oligoflexia bacterium]
MLYLLKLPKSIIALGLISVLTTSYAKAEEELALDDLASPDEIAEELASEQDLLTLDATPTSSEVRLKIFVDKGRQMLWIEEDGRITDKWLVSTGSEKVKCPPNGKCYRASTPNGEFTPYRMHERYVSKKFKVRMDYAIFFNGGIALHETYGDAIKLLGTKQSGGCVRQRGDHAQKIFRLVKYYGPQNTRVIVANSFDRKVSRPGGEIQKEAPHPVARPNIEGEAIHTKLKDVPRPSERPAVKRDPIAKFIDSLFRADQTKPQKPKARKIVTRPAASSSANKKQPCYLLDLITKKNGCSFSNSGQNNSRQMMNTYETGR